jgi:hypothetical protein
MKYVLWLTYSPMITSDRQIASNQEFLIFLNVDETLGENNRILQMTYFMGNNFQLPFCTDVAWTRNRLSTAAFFLQNIQHLEHDQTPGEKPKFFNTETNNFTIVKMAYRWIGYLYLRQFRQLYFNCHDFSDCSSTTNTNSQLNALKSFQKPGRKKTEIPIKSWWIRR